MKNKDTPVKAPLSGMLLSVVAGVTVLAGTTIFSMEAMKMNCNFPAWVAGTFFAAVGAGTIVHAGDIIGYLSPSDDIDLAGCDALNSDESYL
jgi:biotin carboxyl carrier protein